MHGFKGLDSLVLIGFSNATLTEFAQKRQYQSHTEVSSILFFCLGTSHMLKISNQYNVEGSAQLVIVNLKHMEHDCLQGLPRTRIRLSRGT